MFWFVLLIVAIFLVVYKVKKWIEAEEYAEQQRKIKEMEKKRKKEFDEKRRKIYGSSLAQIYNQLPTGVLKEAWGELQILHCNAMDFNNPNTLGPDMDRKRCEARKELKELVGVANWKNLCGDGRIENIDWPMFPNIDMDYIHNLLRSRGVWR